jgi:hypothetical protein
VSSKEAKQQKPALISPVNVEPPSVAVSIEPVALSLSDAARACGLPEWTLNEAILTGSLKAKKPGRERIVLVSELRRWLVSFDNVEPSTAPSILARHGALL